MIAPQPVNLKNRKVGASDTMAPSDSLWATIATNDEGCNCIPVILPETHVESHCVMLLLAATPTGCAAPLWQLEPSLSPRPSPAQLQPQQPSRQRLCMQQLAQSGLQPEPELDALGRPPWLSAPLPASRAQLPAVQCSRWLSDRYAPW
jgi:hypothetical protein